MRPPRIAILVLFLASSIFLFCRAVSSIGRSASTPIVTSPATNAKGSSFRSFFSFSAPFTLFPPNAIITLADDNSTSFAARPAAFGPLLPSRGLRGQLWIGSGFAEESLQAGEGEGELGCSDVPGWDDGRSNDIIQPPSKNIIDNSKSSTAAGKTKSTKRTNRPRGTKSDGPNSADAASNSKSRPANDGTDDYLHQGIQQAQKKSNKDLPAESSHADIQSIQETAEITGKIVLLSRGGCGFLEKVKWAQRRGAVALIVGDNQRGGPLIQMFARGDTSNVTIPSIFTSRTTAHLLSSLMQPGSFIEDIIDENGKPALKVQPSANGRRNRAKQTTITTTTNAPIATPIKSSKFTTTVKKTTIAEKTDSAPQNVSWLRSLFSWGSAADSPDEKSRPPSSGQLDWVIVDDFTDEKDKIIKNGLEKAKKDVGNSSKTKKQSGNDDFQIGVHDWRDPDLIGPSEDEQVQTSTKDSTTQAKSSTKVSGKKSDSNRPSGGSITPGSGEYAAGSVPATSKTSTSGMSNSEGNSANQGGLISKIFGEDDGADFVQAQSPPKAVNTPIVEQAAADDKDAEGHDGLWVVITPSGRATAWVDTLLVLVISPLITLTFVYTLLIIRARIRRRRWRAPKSVVERLPVRTYHTVASTTPARSPRIPSPSPPSPTTPLLQHQHNTARSRPRSQTTTGVASDLLQVNSALSGPRSPSHEKPQFSSEWKKYMTRQVECVVCLEEYVDGVSQVMSLPCGHEFHVECITPWLTTRRRTCPICKGDVVRSLARGSPSSPRYEPYQDDSEDDHNQAEASSSSPRRGDDHDSSSDSDVERGILSPAPRRPRRSRQEVWLSMLSRPF